MALPTTLSTPKTLLQPEWQSSVLRHSTGCTATAFVSLSLLQYHKLLQQISFSATACYSYIVAELLSQGKERLFCEDTGHNLSSIDESGATTSSITELGTKYGVMWPIFIGLWTAFGIHRIIHPRQVGKQNKGWIAFIGKITTIQKKVVS